MRYISETKKEPINVDNYVLYRYCLEYRQVANTLDEVGSSTGIRFYIFKEKEEKQYKLNYRKTKDEALLARMDVINDIDKMQSIIILTNVDLQPTIEDQELYISEYAEKYPAKFLELYKDKKLLEKAFIERLIRAGIFSRPNNSTIVIYDQNQIGANLTEASIWLNRPENSALLLQFRDALNVTRQ